ncbi:histidine phosphatase family protein [Metabacillus arenae]|uniref:Histidine phosphatase family protein n=1 Tax=Metabacillus arenae TaxID=2771434 RepID=A0A926ND85_9BACI|nr:histidine phosphatase family protein [Metabacillus arenae]MBD1378705.1 histidine phosphatase family protein [Metabacillus arenae]
MDDRVVITLFRHGLTESNKKGLYCGWTDIPLSEEGISGLGHQSGHYPDPDLLFSSDLHRCRQSSKLLFPNHEPILSKEWREIHFGDWEEKSYDMLKNDRSYQNWLDHFFHVSPPNGESFHEFSKRVDKGFERVRKALDIQRKHHAVIVTHGGPIKYVLTKYAPLAKDFWEWTVKPGEGVRLYWNKEQLRRGKRCISLQEVPLTVSGNG